MVHIIVPIYRKLPTEDDLISLRQLFVILGNHNITFVHPTSLDLENYKHFSAFFKAFNDDCFTSISGYNQLMLSKFFYENFSEKYLLIYQTDCFVFKDTLLEWCEKDYDYVGAPWIRSRQKIPFFKLFVDRSISKIKSIINFKGNKRSQKDKSLLYNEVGNGGLSLRKRARFIQVLDELNDVVDIYLAPKNSGQFYAEDVFFSIEPKRNGLDFSKPNYKIATQFAIENKQSEAMKINNGQLPFGCHRWDKERDFWRSYFSKFGYTI